ncbi:hypothetical protein D3C76_1076900 [compost metagenome]
MQPVQCLVNAKYRFLNREGRVFRQLHFKLDDHYQQTGNHRHQANRDKQQQLPQAAPGVHDFQHRAIALRPKVFVGYS